MNETVRDRSPQSLENEIIALTHRLKCLRPALSPSMDGLTPMEAHALVLLFCADEKQCSVKPSDIARHLRVSPSAVSQFLRSLERIGLTEKGQSLSSQLRRERSKQFMDMVESVGIDNMNQLVVILEKICDYAEGSDSFVPVSRECDIPGRGVPCA